jgi:3-dehydroquinate synthase
METLSVALHNHQYPIYIGQNLLSEPELFRQHLAGSQVFIVSNATVADLYLARLLENFTDLTVDHLLLPDGEQHKTLSVAAEIFDALLERGHHRSTTIIALGGGVIGDMTGFAAACYQRGVAFIQAPTTLLAQVDSSVGGKTGVNHRLGKNMIGAFYQPQAVIIDTHTLTTLDDRQYSAGLAEVFKYGLLADSEFFRWCEDHIIALMARDLPTVEQAILRSCQIKARIVAADEREQGCRALLNLGHTFGHALESITHYKTYLHGEAVAVGLALAAQLSHALRFISEQEVQRIKTLLQMAALPTCLPHAADAKQMLAHMYRDKKVIDGRLRLIVLAKLGEAQIFDQATEAMIESVLQDNTV